MVVCMMGDGWMDDGRAELDGQEVFTFGSQAGRMDDLAAKLLLLLLLLFSKVK